MTGVCWTGRVRDDRERTALAECRKGMRWRLGERENEKTRLAGLSDYF